MANIYLSPSRISRWFEGKCPASWDFSNRFKDTKYNEVRDRGISVHELLEGKKTEELTFPPDILALRMVEAINNHLNRLPIKIIKKELHERFRLPGTSVVLTRKIDVVGSLDRVPIILDYKTTILGWKSSGNITPQAMGIQSMCYLVKSPHTYDGLAKWPNRIYFLVVDIKCNTKMVEFIPTKADWNNFDLMIRTLPRSLAAYEKFGYPKNYGKHCLSCDFYQPCHKLSPWSDRFEKLHGR